MRPQSSNQQHHREERQRAAPENPADEFAEAARAGRLSADELLSRYVTIVYSRTRSFEETARRLGLDRRTVKAKVDPGMLSRLRDR
ncbi:MAG: hypothetical protein ABSH40_20580 [Bryobacteraceae bacterium]